MSKQLPRLTDLYDLSVERLFLTGPQAILRLILMQSERDRRAGLNTAGYVTGYRGSPVGTVDNQFAAARAELQARHIKFEAGLNEDLAATALWGSQQAEMRGEGRFDGVFGLWYGKGPGVDRSGDVFRHVNMAGTSPHGGVLAIAGDDHSGESSTVVHASDWALADAMMPVLSPAGVQEIIDFGLMGYGLSRYAGVWVGLKAMHDTVESAAVVEAGAGRGAFVLPTDHRLPKGGLSIRPRDDRVPQEERLHVHKLPAVLAFARANALNRVIIAGGRTPRLGIVAAGKNYLDVRQALDELGLDAQGAARAGIRVMKVGMVWPLEPHSMRQFARGLDTVIVVEEKRALIELQLRDILYGEKTRPIVIGKRDEKGEALFASHGVLEPNLIARAIAARLGDRKLAARAAQLPLASAAPPADLAERVPYFCAGCPHNTSTTLPAEARGYAGIGCHWLAQFVPDRRTEGFTHMGGEGANWVGEAPFSTRAHVFQNLGDGTYNHSGLMAIRHAANSGANITYKILYNDAVAMTGGQRNDGGLSVPAIAQQVRAFGVERIAVVADEEGKHGPLGFPAHVSFHHRDELAGLQREMMGVKGASVIIYDQTCAAEKRRRRRRGTLADPSRRVFINELVCEGCGDCGEQSNCVAIAPVETEFGRKRRIDQSVCNKDFSCLKGFCPSFVTVEGGQLRKPEVLRIEMPKAALPAPTLPDLTRPWSILVAGIGGTGVVTIGHILGMAAHIEGKGAALIDMVGISQKNGAVVTHLKIAAEPADIAAVRVARGGADLVLGCDLVTAASARILAGASPERTAAIVNGHETMPAQFTHDADFTLPARRLLARIGKTVAGGQLFTVDATGLAMRLLGDAMAANLLTLGYAWQKGLVPVGEEAILAAVRLNGVAVAMNIAAFGWGRRAAADEGAVRRAGGEDEARGPESLAETIARRAEFLAAYQDEAYGAAYRDFVAGVSARAPASFALSVARNLFKLMAYKDEYEVARLHSDPAFRASLARQFEGSYRLSFHLSPPLLAPVDRETGRPRKLRFGPWMMTAFRLLARLKVLRGTRLDPFGRSAERRLERQLIADYRALIETLTPRLTAANLKTAEALAALPETIRGFGPVKAQSIARAKARQAELLAALDGAGAALQQAAE